MAISLSLEHYLDGQGVAYDALAHSRTDCAARSAVASHVPLSQVAKGVVLSSRTGYVLAVVPASRRLELDKVGRCLQHPVALATESELSGLFPDCEAGAVPAVGAPYGLRTVLDESLTQPDDVYFEAGDHCTLVHLRRDDFHQLMRTVAHGQISAEAIDGDRASA